MPAQGNALGSCIGNRLRLPESVGAAKPASSCLSRLGGRPIINWFPTRSAEEFFARSGGSESRGRVCRSMDWMMHVSVKFQDERLDFEIPEDRVVATWSAPVGMEPPQAIEALRDALETPWDFPPLRQMIVPGDRVVIAMDSSMAHAGPILEVIGQILLGAGVEPDGVTVLTPTAGITGMDGASIRGATLVVHDSRDRSQLAYLAATKEGRRIYLNRILTDADVVIPVGRLGYDPILGHRGPWSVLFPELSERETIDAYRGRLPTEAEGHIGARARANLDESFEVSWLLGSQFHLGVVPGFAGPAAFVAGRENAVRERGIAALDRYWKLESDSRAELVVVGIGSPGTITSIDDLAEGVARACAMVQHGGKIVALSRAEGSIGPALQRLIAAEDPKHRAAALRGHEGDDDFIAAHRLARALAWADIFVLSGLDKDVLDDLSVVALDNPEQARRLVAKSGSCSFVSQAERTWALVSSENEG
jgi:lactate racemase